VGSIPGTEVKLKGQLQSTSSAKQSDPLLLAMGWYPTFAGTAPGSPVNAAIALDGAQFTYDAAGQSYSWLHSAPLLGTHSLAFAVPGRASEALSFTLPGAVTVSSPSANQSFASGSAVSIAWSVPTSARASPCSSGCSPSVDPIMQAAALPACAHAVRVVYGTVLGVPALYLALAGSV
jgi:hypothetical protein